MIKSGENALKMLNRKYSFNETVDIPQNSSLDEILVKYNITESDFKKLNPSYSEGKAQTAKIKSKIPYIRVVTNTSVNEKTILKYRTRSVDDSTMYEGETKISTTGTDGLKTTSKSICKINGETIFEKTVKEEITDAVDEILLVGTKKYSKGKATGTFANPYDGKLSSRFGQRGSRQHKGIDICGSIGDSIEASDGGEVVYADWEQGYGLVVKINHQNGYTTFYAHCDKLFVKAGDKVSKGDVIAALGNTGNSTGPHLHFEIRKTEDNTPLDPLTYIDSIKDENNK